MTVKLKHITNILETFAPLNLQEGYDNCGLQTGDLEQEISSAIISLDAGMEVINEAIENKCNLIITHHPIIFHPMKQINNLSVTGQVLIKAIKNDIAIYSMHTNLDNAFEGLNHKLAQKIGLTEISALIPKKGLLSKLVTFCPEEYAEKVRDALFAAGAGRIGNYSHCSYNIKGTGTFKPDEGSTPFSGRLNQLHVGEEIRIETIFPAYNEKRIISALLNSHPYEEVAYDIFALNNEWEKFSTGLTGIFASPLKESEFIELLKKALEIPFIRHNHLRNRQIRKVAICTGAGGAFLTNAINSGADAFITADIRYSSFQEAGENILLTDCGHFETEIFAKEIIHDVLTKKIPNFAVLVSKNEQNPVKYS